MTTEKDSDKPESDSPDASKAADAPKRRAPRRRAQAVADAPEAVVTGESAQTAAEASSPGTTKKRTKTATKAPNRSTSKKDAAAKPSGEQPRKRRSRAKPAEAGAASTAGGGGERVAAVAEAPPQVQVRPLPRLQARLCDEIAPVLMQEFSYTSPMQVPRLSKAVLNIGLGEALENARAIESATNDLMLIAGQRPVVTRARKSIAGFKLREGMPIGVSVTLRGRRMYEFVDRLVSSTLRGSGTSSACPERPSTEEATTLWASASRLSSRR